MTEFDELLDEVLCCDVNVEPPAGLEARVGAALAASSRGSSRRRGVWALAALAAMLAFAAAMPEVMQILARAPSRRVPMAPLSPSSPARLISDGLDRKTPAAPAMRRVVDRWPADRRHSRSRTEATHVASLAPITIPPLEIASLKFDNTHEGDIR